MEIMQNLVPFIGLVVLIATFFLKARTQHFLHSVFITFFGIMSLLFNFGVIGFNPLGITSLKYILTLVVVMAGRELIRKGVVEKSHGTGSMSIWFGICIILAVLVPAMAEVGALTFRLPEYPGIIDSMLYIAGGVLLFIGAAKTGE